MKAIYLIAIGLVAIPKIYAQEPADALRYSWLTQNGTARNQAIGGAGVSLGGEFSSLFINPAGLGFYKTSEFVLTPGYSLKNFNSTYKSNSEKSNDNNFNLGASGLLISSPTPDRPIRSFTFAIGVNRIADFNKNIYYKGNNSTSSYSEKYLEELINDNATDPNQALQDYPYGSSEALQTYLINPTYNSDSSQVTGYSSVANPTYGLIQENTIHTSGGITQFSLGCGLSLKDKWFFGGGLNFTFLNYYRDAQYKESDASGNANNNFNYFEVNETLHTNAIGGNINLGAIYKPSEDVRLGLSFQIPTNYESAKDDYNVTVITDLEGYGGAGIKQQSATDLNNGQLLESKYNLNTPLKIAAGASYVFHDAADVKNQKGFITADVEYVNYKGANFKAIDNTDAVSKDYYTSLNHAIDNIYKNAFNARIGGELKFNTYMLRLGGAYYGNPYKNENANLYKMSGGVGYRNKGIFIDLTYVYTLSKDIHYPYLLQDKPNIPATIKNTGGNIIATIGFKI